MRRIAIVPLMLLLLAPLPACDLAVDIQLDDDPPRRVVLTDAPVSSEWSYRAHALVFDAPLDLELELILFEDDRFRLWMDAAADEELEREVVSGTYRWEGDALLLRDEGGNVQRLRLRGDELVPDAGWKWTLARESLGLPDFGLERVR
ncbi:MAG: hypothetical protein R3199_02085 [Gemmatimonadota bacterium]|nr:hypothetical protein [Gemmatimonadota bacterium]